MITFETGKMARFANGAVVMAMDDTRVLSTIASSKSDGARDFLPLTVCNITIHGNLMFKFIHESDFFHGVGCFVYLFIFAFNVCSHSSGCSNCWYRKKKESNEKFS